MLNRASNLPRKCPALTSLHSTKITPESAYFERTERGRFELPVRFPARSLSKTVD